MVSSSRKIRNRRRGGDSLTAAGVGIAVAEQSPDFLFSAMRCVDRQYDYRQQDRQHQIKQLWLDEPHRYSLLICRITIITPQ